MISKLYLFSLLTLHSAGAALEASEIQVYWSSELLPENSVWFTNPPPVEDIRYRLSRQAGLQWRTSSGKQGAVFRPDPATRYQSILGIGTSLEDTTIYAIRKSRTEKEIRQLLKLLIDPVTGLGFSLFRMTIGTSDFSDARQYSDHPQGFYSYQDDPEIPFSIRNDIKLGIVETVQMLIQEANRLEPPVELKFFASSWSPPGWMKTSGELIGGTLKSGYEKQLAKYFRRFVESYEELGIPIFALTIQNEPNFLPSTYPGMRLSPEQEARIVQAVTQEFRNPAKPRRKLDTRIWINDHNFEYWRNADKVLTALAESDSKHFVDGVAFHNYSRSPASNMTRLHQKHPDMDIFMTEHSEWGVSGMHNIQLYFQNWARSYAYWVTMSTRDPDEHNQGPYNRIGELSPTLLIQDNRAPDGWYPTPEFFMIAQFSRYIRPGAFRIGCSNGDPETLSSVAFLNPDQTIVLVLVNQTDEEQDFTIDFRAASASGRQPPKSIGTYIWKAD